MFYVLVGFGDLPRAIHADEPTAADDYWMPVTRDEWYELAADGYRVALAWASAGRG